MKKRLSEFFLAVLDLPSAYFYVGIVLICTSLLVASRLRQTPEPIRSTSTPIESLPFDEQPLPASSQIDLYSNLEETAGEGVRDGMLLRTAIDKLETQIVAVVTGRASVSPITIAADFRGTGIDRDRFQPRFTDDKIEVRRWQATEKAPTFTGDETLERLVLNVLKPTKDLEDFRIEMKVFSTNLLDGSLISGVVAESYGKTAIDQGLQATSIWKLTWQHSQQELKLKSMEVQAQEEITTTVAGARLFADCTESVFQHSDTLKNQLGFGLDQWSRRIPNMDIVGNHGIAVGDINRDGLDDLYICQPHGLPNCLLVQNPDGTVEDFSSSSKLDILDQSHAALIIDIDNDRDQDLVVSTDAHLLLMSNDGKNCFQLEHALPIGCYAHSISAADFDQDGDLDLFLCKPRDLNRQSDILMFPAHVDSADDGGRNVLLRNDEGWVFKDVTEQCGITHRNRFHSQSAVWNDFDNDGDADLYITNEFATDQLFENKDGWFDEVSEKVGLTVPARHRSVSVGEFNGDGRLDFFVATDVSLSAFRELRNRSQQLQRNQSADEIRSTMLGENQVWLVGDAKQKFHPFFLKAPIFSSESAFGSATADLNNDGLDDVIVTNGFLSRSATEEVDELFYSTVFSDSTATAALRPAKRSASEVLELTTVSSKSVAKLSPDQRLAEDISRRTHELSDLVREGYSFGGNQRNRCYLSIGALGFANLSALSGTDLLDDSRAIATTDWDSDGDVDIVMTCRGGPQIRILINQLNSQNNYLQFDLVGTESNVDAIGTRVELYLEGRQSPLVKSLQAGSGNLSQSTKRLTFGLGDSSAVERVAVTWPNGSSQSFSGVVANTRYEIVEGEPLLAEKSDSRFELAIKESTISSTRSLPHGSGNAIFYPRPPISKLQFLAERDKWYTLEPVNKRPVIAVFWERNSDSEELIRDISRESIQLKNENVDCVAIFVDSKESDPDQLLQYTKNVLKRYEFPFRSGIASLGTKDKLKYLAGDWLNYQQMPSRPFAVLLDEEGRACSFYSSDHLSMDQLIEDLDLVDKSQWRYRDSVSNLGGQWIARYRYPKLNRLRTRFQEVGYQVDSDLMLEESKAQRAYELCQKAIELDSSGDSKAARDYFAQALEMDPRCVPAYIGEGQLLRRLARENSTSPEDKIQFRNAAIVNFEDAIELDPVNSEAHIGLAETAVDQNRIDQALEQLTQQLQLDPTNYQIHAIIGRLLFHQQRYKESAKYLVNAFEQRPTLPYLAGDLGFLYLRCGEFNLAKKFLSLANRMRPSDHNIVRALAEAEFFTKSFEDAIATLKSFAKPATNERRSKKMLAWLLATCPKKAYRDGEESKKITYPMVQLMGDRSPSTLEIYAASLAELGQFDQALKFQQQAVDLINSNQSVERYSAAQVKGLLSRLALYKTKRPYRTENLTQIPIQPRDQL